MKIGSLCTGYGGLDHAVQDFFGGELAFVADNFPGAQKLLEFHYPDVPDLGDITQVAWEDIDRVDILTAGFPCQDVSCAGSRKGLGKDTRTGIWSHVAEAIGVLRPRLVLLENVRGLLSARADSDLEYCSWCMGDDGDEPVLRACGAVLADLADLGFDAEWALVSAAEAGAPHKRERVFILASPAADAAGDRWPPKAERIERSGRAQASQGQAAGAARAVLDWGPYEPAIRRWEHAIGRYAPSPTEFSRIRERLSPRFVEWMMGLEEGWVTGVPGLSYAHQLRLLGNGVVPQQALLALDYLWAAR